jgi:hypothetical protein
MMQNWRRCCGWRPSPMRYVEVPVASLTYFAARAKATSTTSWRQQDDRSATGGRCAFCFYGLVLSGH